MNDMSDIFLESQDSPQMAQAFNIQLPTINIGWILAFLIIVSVILTIPFFILNKYFSYQISKEQEEFMKKEEKKGKGLVHKIVYGDN